MDADTDLDGQWMALALEQARQAAAAGEVPVGAVVVRGGHLVATGRNGPIAGHDPTAHAEIVALREAARLLGNYRLDGCTLYVTLEPCAMCSGAMLHARLGRVVFGANEPHTGCAGSVLDLFASPRLNHHTQVTGGVLADACGQLLREFFRPRRVNPAPLRDDALRSPASVFAHWPPMPGSMAFASQWPQLAGLRLYWYDTGPADQPQATLYVHGPEGAAGVWSEEMAQAQARQRRALAVDLLGFGRSDKPKKAQFHSLQTHAQILHALCQHCGLQSVELVAPSSMGILLRAVQALDPVRYTVAPARCGLQLVPPPWDAAYPDKGHRAGPQALLNWSAED